MTRCLIVLVLLTLINCALQIETIPESRQATGVKVGEVGDNSAIVWMRVTESAARNRDGIERRGRVQPLDSELKPRNLEGSAPGAPGQVPSLASFLARGRIVCSCSRRKTGTG